VFATALRRVLRYLKSPSAVSNPTNPSMTPSSDQPLRDAPGTGAQFATTHWSVVLAAGQSTSREANQALEILNWFAPRLRRRWPVRIRSMRNWVICLPCFASEPQNGS